jgi:hypothetical protein
MNLDIGQIIRDEVEHPFNQPMDLVHLSLLVGILMVLAVLWSRVLVHIEHAATVI